MISGLAIVRSAITRFIPGVLLFLGCCLYATAKLKGIALGASQMDGLTALTLFMALGFSASILSMRLVGRSSIDAFGRRGVLAGFVSPIWLLAFEMLHGSRVSLTLNCSFAFVAGVVATMALFAPVSSIGAMRTRQGTQTI